MATQPTSLYVGDTGTAIILDTEVNISAATAVSIEAMKPNGTIVSWPAVISGGTAVRFDTLPNSIDMHGRWRMQAKVTMPGGETWRGGTYSIMVKPLFL